MNLSLFQCTLFILFIVFIFDLYRENYKAYKDQTISLTDNKENTENENIYDQHNKVSYILESPYIMDLKSNTKVLEFLNGCAFQKSITSLESRKACLLRHSFIDLY